MTVRFAVRLCACVSATVQFRAKRVAETVCEMCRTTSAGATLNVHDGYPFTSARSHPISYRDGAMNCPFAPHMASSLLPQMFGI